MSEKDELLEAIKEAPQSTGKSMMIKSLKGEKLSASQAIKAHCFCCEGYFLQGREDCEVPTCALYPFMPYSSKKQKSRAGSKLTTEQKTKMQEGRRKKR